MKYCNFFICSFFCQIFGKCDLKNLFTKGAVIIDSKYKRNIGARLRNMNEYGRQKIMTFQQTYKQINKIKIRSAF